ncbi:hypothetical protein [Nocardia tengchongensis]|uniref:hypothetical protein n=1 Tax=Nocardia tengchongensis TaxID=2055889 RepID=UPI0036509987
MHLQVLIVAGELQVLLGVSPVPRREVFVLPAVPRGDSHQFIDLCGGPLVHRQHPREAVHEVVVAGVGDSEFATQLREVVEVIGLDGFDGGGGRFGGHGLSNPRRGISRPADSPRTLAVRRSGGP